MKLAILIHFLESEKPKIKEILSSFQSQLDALNKDDEAEVVFFSDNGETSEEEKKEWLVKQTKARSYIFVDASTEIDNYFILKRLNAIKNGWSLEKLLSLQVYNKINLN